jgi:hypothetical protein
MTEARPVQIKSSRDLLRAPDKQAAPAGIELYDRRDITVRWYSRLDGREHVFTGTIRLLNVTELARAANGFLRLTGGVQFDLLPSEVRNRLWLQSKLFVMLDGQPGADGLLDAFDTDRLLLVSVYQEVDKLEAECFRDVLGEGEGEPGQPRVVVASRRSVAPTSSAATP